MEVNQVMEKVNAALEEANRAYDKAAAIAKEHLGNMLQQWLKENPTIGAFGWTQYTPYFNDGEECVFGVHEPQFISADKIPQDEDLSYNEHLSPEDISFSVWDHRLEKGELGNIGVSIETYRACKKMKDLLGKIDDDIMRDVFGDHVCVLVTHEGVTVEEYEHD